VRQGHEFSLGHAMNIDVRADAVLYALITQPLLDGNQLFR
jgi:hypothetical protein